jgi:hypothetical protein
MMLLLTRSAQDQLVTLRVTDSQVACIGLAIASTFIDVAVGNWLASRTRVITRAPFAFATWLPVQLRRLRLTQSPLALSYCPRLTTVKKAATKETPKLTAFSVARFLGQRVTPSSRLQHTPWVPSRLPPRSPPVPHTSAPTNSSRPLTIRPAKSRPRILGSSALGSRPSALAMSLGLIPAASACTSTSRRLACGSRRSVTSKPQWARVAECKQPS